MSRRILVTGASGFIGSALCRRLLRDGDLVTALVRDEDPPEGCAVIRGDLVSSDGCRRAMLSQPWDVVYHLGAQALVGVGHMDPLTTLQSNVAGTWNILEGIRQHPGRPRLVLASSDKAYGETEPGIPYMEDFALAGSGLYDCSKACADLIAQSYAREHGLQIMIARLGNVYGPGDREMSRIVPSLIADIVALRDPVIHSDGTPVRDYLYVDDAVEAYLLLGRMASGPGHAAYNFSGGRPIAVRALAETMLDVARELHWGERLGPVVLGLRGEHEIPYQALDCSKAKQELGWTPRISLEEGLRRTLTAAMEGWHG